MKYVTSEIPQVKLHYEKIKKFSSHFPLCAEKYHPTFRCSLFAFFLNGAPF